jgi:glycosyltransferase 2 family protein
VRIVSEVEPTSLLIPLLLGLLSYAAMARSYQGIAHAAGADLPFGAWLRITFVSNTINYIVTSGGLSGLAVRMLLLSKHGVASGRAVVISFVQTFLTNFTLLLFIIAGLASLVVREHVPRGEVIAGLVAVTVFSVILGYASVLVVNRRVRRLTLFFLTHRAHQVLQRVLPRWAPSRQRLLRLRRNMNEGFDFLLDRREKMIWPVIWILLDWVLTLAILWWAFRSLNNPVPVTVVLIGFGVGVLASLISLVPGGLGIMEGSMTAVFVSLGVPKSVALLSALIFRLSYHVTPLLVSAFLFRGLFRQAITDLETARDG